AAGWTKARGTDWQLSRRCDALFVAYAENNFLDAIGAAFVIDDRLRSEFREAKKTRPTQERIAADLLFPSGNKRHKGKAGKVVSRQKALASKKPVGIEIRIETGSLGHKQVMLYLRLLISFLRLLAFLLADGMIHLRGMSLIHLACGRP